MDLSCDVGYWTKHYLTAGYGIKDAITLAKFQVKVVTKAKARDERVLGERLRAAQRGPLRYEPDQGVRKRL